MLPGIYINGTKNGQLHALADLKIPVLLLKSA
jgi:hypothetical protein